MSLNAILWFFFLKNEEQNNFVQTEQLKDWQTEYLTYIEELKNTLYACGSYIGGGGVG